MKKKRESENHPEIPSLDQGLLLAHGQPSALQRLALWHGGQVHFGRE